MKNKDSSLAVTCTVILEYSAELLRARCEVSATVKIQVLVYWVVTPSRIITTQLNWLLRVNT